MLQARSKSLGRRKTLFPRCHVPFLEVILRYFMLESDCSYEKVVETSVSGFQLVFIWKGVSQEGFFSFLPRDHSSVSTQLSCLG